MKELNEYKDYECDDIVEEGRMVAMMCIHSVYDELKDEEEVSCEDMDKVKDAMKTLYYSHHIESHK